MNNESLWVRSAVLVPILLYYSNGCFSSGGATDTISGFCDSQFGTTGARCPNVGAAADAGTLIDAGRVADASTRLDAGTAADASTAPDGGTAADSGTSAPVVVTDPTVASITNIEYAVVGPGVGCVDSSSGLESRCVRMLLNVHRPAAFTGRLPVIVYVPGGVGNAKDLDPMLHQAFVPTGFAWIQIDKSSDPSEGGNNASGLSNHMDQIQNVNAAIRWARANAAAYRLDDTKIALIGFSAGGALSAAAAVTAGNAAFEGTVGPHAGVSSRVRAVVTAPAVFELELDPGDCQELVNRGIRPNVQSCEDEFKLDNLTWVGCASTGNLAADYAACIPTLRQGSAITHVSPDDPPFLMLVGSDDAFAHAQQRRFEAALTRAGVAATFTICPGAGHHVLASLVNESRPGFPNLATVTSFLANHGVRP